MVLYLVCIFPIEPSQHDDDVDVAHQHSYKEWQKKKRQRPKEIREASKKSKRDIPQGMKAQGYFGCE